MAGRGWERVSFRGTYHVLDSPAPLYPGFGVAASGQNGYHRPDSKRECHNGASVMARQCATQRVVRGIPRVPRLLNTWRAIGLVASGPTSGGRIGYNRHRSADGPPAESNSPFDIRYSTFAIIPCPHAEKPAPSPSAPPRSAAMPVPRLRGLRATALAALNQSRFTHPVGVTARRSGRGRT